MPRSAEGHGLHNAVQCVRDGDKCVMRKLSQAEYDKYYKVEQGA